MTTQKPGVRPAVPHFSSGPCAKRPGWSLQALTDAALGALAPLQDRQSEAQARHRSHPRGAGSPRRLPHRHRAGLRYRRRRDGAVVAARRRGLSPCWPGNRSAKAGSRDVDKAAQACRTSPSSRRPMASCPICRRSISTATWSSPGTAPPPACACPTATGSPPTAKVLPSATPPRRLRARRSIGPSSMS